jgi:glycosyltransferase involved in cell wall biosynthesis
MKRILRNDRSGSSHLRAIFVLEQTLGHVTHSQNLRSLLADEPQLAATFLPIRPDVDGIARHIPGYGNWTVRAGIRARVALRRFTGLHHRPPADAMFIHSQVPAILTGGWMRKVPTVVSLDATPLQYDQLGEYYAHDVSSARVEAWKWKANQRCFRRARHLVTWSQWALESLVDDYAIDRAAITVIPPGVDVERWSRNEPRPDPGGGPVRVLFVGGDLHRKGGDLLIEAARRLRLDPTTPEFEVHVVTRSDVVDEPGVHVYRDFGPNDPALIELYHGCDIFCLPTMGDCLPMVLSEAGAAEMALVSTDVGAIREVVRDGETGILIPSGDLDALVDALRRLFGDPAERRRMGEAAVELVRSRYDALRNARQIVDLLRVVARHDVPG